MKLLIESKLQRLSRRGNEIKKRSPSVLKKKKVWGQRKLSVTWASQHQEPLGIKNRHHPQFRQCYLRTNSKSQRIITQAQTVYISFCSLTDSVCHYGNGVLEPGHSTSPWIPSHSTQKNSSSSVSLAGLHQNSYWERGTAFNPPVYLRLLIFLPAILIPACASSSLAFCMMYSAY